MSFKAEFLIDGNWYDNALRFATYEEAKANAEDKFILWTVPSACRAVESLDPVNYSYVDGRLAEPSPPASSETSAGLRASLSSDGTDDLASLKRGAS